ncbi:hypothetical protein N4T20_12930 [Flavobacterium sp. TR2]|uniref:hypothetical protein n=1 Tax=Flavobacterium sp. TR2 TaxID=2977321 RepID=UPI0021B098F8|nr:hypothetical protein [Flavobacterium sp. TR2]UWY26619.1 hypothetical protein N4T20_12930 [Flavobacterium sp. TR2]
MKKFTKLVKSVLFLTFVLLMTNCAPNEAEESSNVQAVDEAKNWYNIHKEEFNSPVLEYVSDLKWENAIISDGIDGLVVEVPFTLTDNLRTSNGQGNLYNDHHRLVFIKNEPNNFKTYYVQIFTDNKNSSSLDKSYSYYAMKENYNGKVFVQDLITNKTNVLKFKNGEQSKSSSTSKWREEFYDCTFLGWIGEDGSFEPIKLLYCDGGSGSDDGGPTYGGGPIAGGGGTGSTPSTEIRIIDNLTGKAKCINNLLSSGGNDFVKYIFNQFAGKSEFNIEIISLPNVYTPTNQEVNGTTRFNKVDSLITIEISTSRLDGIAALESARIILHEYIHADIYRKLNTANSKDIDASDFKKVFETYETQHNAMAQVYLNSMAGALKEFHKTVLSNDYINYMNYYGEAPSDEFYEAMAWGGLKDSNVKAWTNLPADKKASINSLASRVPILGKTAPCP